MIEGAVAVLGGLLILVVVWVVLAVPDLLDALVKRIEGGRGVRSCEDCGERLRPQEGATCGQCRDIRRARLAEGARGTAAGRGEGDNAS